MSQNKSGSRRRVGLSITLGLAILMSGCGSHTVNTDDQLGPITPGPIPTYIPGPVPTYIPEPDPDPTDTGDLLPPITESFSVTGPGGSDPKYVTTVDTDNILKIKITAGRAGKVSVPGYGFYAEYGCVQYTVEVLGHSVTTNTLAVNDSSLKWNCPNAPNSQVLNFSSRLSPGHGPVKIKVKAESYDFYCKLCQSHPGNDCSYVCPLRGVYSTHTVKGTLSIQVNGTSL